MCQMYQNLQPTGHMNWRSWEGSSVFVDGSILSQCVRVGPLCGAGDEELRRAANLDA